jgi:hypothetical protein
MPDTDFDAGRRKGVTAAAHMLEQLVAPFADDPRDNEDDRIRVTVTLNWAHVLRSLGEDTVVIPVADDPRHANHDFHAGYLDGLRAAAELFKVFSETQWRTGDAQLEDVCQKAAKTWAKCLLLIASGAEK